MKEQQRRGNASPNQSGWNRQGWILLSAVLAVMLVIILSPGTYDSAQGGSFQSNLPERKPDYWIRSDQGGQIEFGGVLAILPAGFTEQGGASVFGDVVQSSGLAKSLKPLAGTEFAFGIWPTQVQTDYPKPVEFRIWLNAAEFPGGGEESLLFMMYDPIQGNWQRVPSAFDPGTYQVVAHVDSFTPVPDDFPDWGGRTFFGLFFPDQAGDVPLTPGLSRVNTNANLRAGPGINYPVVGYAPAGSEINLVASNPSGTWLLLSDGDWIAARLVDGVPPLPTSTAVPPTPTDASVIPTREPTSTPNASVDRTPVSNSGLTAKIAYGTIVSGELMDLDAGQSGSAGNPDLAVVFSGETPSLILVNNSMISRPVDAFGRRDLCAQVAHNRSTLDIDPEARRTYACMETSDGNLASISVRPSTVMTHALNIVSAVWMSDTQHLD